MTIPGEDAILDAARAEGRKKLRAGIYTRMSLAAMGDTTKVDDQQSICRDLAERRGDMEVADVYCDNNASAWQPNRKRKEWDRMLADIEAGKLDAIIVYHGDRLIRQPWDLEMLLRLAKGKGIHLASPTGTRNLDSDEDQFVLSIEAAMARRESANTSRRRKNQYARWRREGRVRPGGRGGRAFGFESDGVTHRTADRCILATREEESEVDVLREAARRILDGEPTSLVARDIAARGWDTPSGAPMNAGTLKKMLMRPRMAGLMPDGENTAAWEPVLDRPAWERVCEILADKAATFAYATNARRWLLSGIAVCGAVSGGVACGAPMQLRPSKGRGRQEYANGYACSRAGCRKSYRSAAHLDAYVGARVVERLRNQRNPEPRVPADPGAAAEWGALAKERAETEKLAQDYSTSAGRLSLLMARLDSIDARMAQLRERETSDSRARLIERYRGITREQWENDLALDVKRALVAACFRVTVLPASGRGPGFRVQDVRLDPA